MAGLSPRGAKLGRYYRSGQLDAGLVIFRIDNRDAWYPVKCSITMNGKTTGISVGRRWLFPDLASAGHARLIGNLSLNLEFKTF